MRKLLTLIIFFLFSCTNGDKEQIVKIGENASVAIPAFLTKVNDLHEDASLQYQHAWKEFYVIGIEESKNEVQRVFEKNEMDDDTYENNIDDYAKVHLESIKGGIKYPSQSDLIDTTVNNMPAKITTIEGEVEGYNLFYSIGFYKGENKYYCIESWTRKTNKHKYKSKMKKILYSIKELKPGKDVK